MSILQCQQLKVTVANKTVCQQLDWRIEHGQFWVILGANGVGKTTLLHTLAGLRKADAGKILLQEKILENYSPRQRAKQIALLLQQTHPPFPSSVIDAVMCGRHPHIPYWRWPQQNDHDIVADAMQRLELNHLQQQCITTLSGGELQRVQLATLLSQTPNLYLIDEPLTHLDIKYQLKIMRHFQKLCQSQAATVIMVIHDLLLAQHFSSHALALFGNGKYMLGEKSAIIKNDHLQALYQCEDLQPLFQG